MSVDKLKRVIWLLREKYPGCTTFSLVALRIAIMEEIGTSEQCIKLNQKKILELGYLKRISRWQFHDEGVQY